MSGALFEFIIILLLILLNGVFAMSELAVVSARRSKLQHMAGENTRGAQAALDLAASPNRFLSTVQLGITLVGIFAGAFGGSTLARELAAVLAEIPALAPYSQALSLIAVVSLITYLSVVIGELVPKRIALNSAERIAALVARPMQRLSFLATPFVRLLALSTELVLRVLGVEASVEEISEEEIRALVREGAQRGVIEEAERQMVERVFLLNDRPLEAIMTPRPSIVWLDVNDAADVHQETVRKGAHTRFPVADGDLDNVLGVARAKDLLGDCLDGRPFQLRDSLQPPLFLPGGMRALRALERFKQTGTHLGLVMDEFGGIDGLVTLIDILEALVGDIPTPEELSEPLIVRRGDGSWLVDGLLSIDEFQDAFDLDRLPGEGDYQSVGGFIVLMIGDIPTEGDNFTWNGYRFEVVDMDGQRVDKVLINKVEADA